MQAKEILVVDNSINPFTKFIFNNFDFNVNTLDLDGHATFHSMGRIMAVTPKNAVFSKQDVLHMNVKPSSPEIDKSGNI